MRRLIFLAVMLLAGAAASKWARPNLDVPISRLILNVEGKLRAHPKDAEAAYHLGRLHSMAYAETKGNVQLYGTESEFQYPAWMTLKVVRTGKTPVLTKEELGHLRKSLEYYHRATILDPQKGLYRLGLAWMHEQAAPFASQLGPLSWMKKSPTTASLKSAALASYRSLYRDFLDEDLQSEGHIQGVQDVYVSEDAGAGIIRLGGKHLAVKERRAIEANIKKLHGKTVGVTPIVFPLDRRAPFESLVEDGKKVEFDLAGDGNSRQWSWVTSKTGILVWDPRRTGRITSGRQMFGSVTFWMFYNDGYAALASLDDDGDGWLIGKEIGGIAVWHDANSDGSSQPGEVRPIGEWKIAAIRAHATGSSPVLMARHGIVFRDGGTASTYDWVPTGVTATSSSFSPRP